MACHVSAFPAIEQYLQLSQGHQELYTDCFRPSSYVTSSLMSLKNEEDPFLVNENYEKMLPPMMPINYQNVDSVPDSNFNYLAEHSPELVDLDELKPDIINELTQSSNPLDHYNTDPRNWSETDVKQWVMTKLNSSGISLDTVCWLSINGLGLCSCSQDDLLKYLRNPAATNIIYSELKKLKNEYQILDCPSSFDYHSYPLPNSVMGTQKSDTFYAIKDYLKRTSPTTEQYSPKFNSDSNDSLSSVSISPPPIMDNNGSYDQNSEPKTRHKQHIHLWQFLKDLLSEADKHNNCIKWINVKDGIFKIEDSAHVAKLWGMRKNRPAMNYDKLSRSLRQYYKKGIIQKTSASKRLVYQFGASYL